MPRRTTAPGSDIRASRSNRVLIGQRIARRRTEMGLSQTELAARFGVSRAAISQYEVGIGDLNAGDMTFLAEVLDVPVTYFFLDEYQADPKSRLGLMISYFVRLPDAYQRVTLRLLKSTVLGIHGRYRVDDIIKELDGPVDKIADLREELRKLPETT